MENPFVGISKEQLSLLPSEQYEGRIIMIDNDSQINAAISELKNSDVIGFDTETRPSFKKGLSNNVALVQLANKDTVYLFRINKITNISPIFQLLEDKNLLKVGLSLRDDFHNLKKLQDFSPENFIDLQNMVREYRISDSSLSKIYAVLFGKRISKNQRLTNWEADELTTAQAHYAALDARACLDIYFHLKEGNFDYKDSEYLYYPENRSEIEDENTTI